MTPDKEKLLWTAVIALVCTGVVRFVMSGLLPALSSLGGDFAATFPADYFARLRPDFPRAEVWGAGTGVWYYGPLMHIVTLPLLLSPTWALVPKIWAVTNVACIATMFVLLTKSADGRLPVLLLGGLWLLYQPLANCLAQGNIEIFEMLLIVGALYYLRRHSHLRSGFLLGAAAMVKFLPIGFLGWAVLRRQWSCALAGVAMIAVIAAWTGETLGWRESMAVRYIRAGWSDSFLGNHQLSITSMFQRRTAIYDQVGPAARWFPPTRRESAVFAGMISSLALALVYAVMFFRTRMTSVDDDFGVLFLLMLLLPPWNHDYYYVFALVPISRLVLTAIAERDYVLGALVGLGYILISPPLPFSHLNNVGFESFAYFMNWHDIPTLGALVLLFAMTLRHVAALEPAEVPIDREPPYEPTWAACLPDTTDGGIGASLGSSTNR